MTTCARMCAMTTLPVFIHCPCPNARAYARLAFAQPILTIPHGRRENTSPFSVHNFCATIFRDLSIIIVNSSWQDRYLQSRESCGFTPLPLINTYARVYYEWEADILTAMDAHVSHMSALVAGPPKPLKAVTTVDKSAPAIDAEVSTEHVHACMYIIDRTDFFRNSSTALPWTKTRDTSAPQLDAAVSAPALRVALAHRLARSSCVQYVCSMHAPALRWPKLRAH